MAEGKKSFTAYCDWHLTMSKLTDEEAGKLMKMLFSYVNDLSPEPPDRLTELLFEPIKTTLKRDLKKWESKSKTNSYNGSKGGRPKKATESEPNPNKPNALFENPKEPSGFFNNPEKPVRVSVSVRDRVRERDKEKKDDSTSAKIKIFTADVQNCFSEILKSFDSHLHPKTEKQKNDWLKTVDDLNRIDGHPFEVIFEVVKHIRADSFWAKNFLSLTKLRAKNKDGVQFFIVFAEHLKSTNSKFRKNEPIISESEFNEMCARNSASG